MLLKFASDLDRRFELIEAEFGALLFEHQDVVDAALHTPLRVQEPDRNRLSFPVVEFDQLRGLRDVSLVESGDGREKVDLAWVAVIVDEKDKTAVRGCVERAGELRLAMQTHCALLDKRFRSEEVDVLAREELPGKDLLGDSSLLLENSDPGADRLAADENDVGVLTTDTGEQLQHRRQDSGRERRYAAAVQVELLPGFRRETGRQGGSHASHAPRAHETAH